MFDGGIWVGWLFEEGCDRENGWICVYYMCLLGGNDLDIGKYL